MKTFEELCAIEPLLADLWTMAKAVRMRDKRRGWNPNRVWYADFKPQLERLVGMHCGRDDMKSSEDYNTAYSAIQRALTKD